MAKWINLLEVVYPIGSIYQSTKNLSPASIVGGTWEQITEKFLFAAGSTYMAGETGGEATHALSIAEMPAHTHGVVAMHYRLGANDKTGGDGGGNWTQESFSSSTTGSGKSHNNMPPYYVIYIWERVS